MHDGVSVHAVFCDDVRTELDGKITLVGMHMRGVTVNGTAPAALPQLWLALWVTYSASLIPDTIRIVAKGDCLDSQPFDATLNPRSDAETEIASADLNEYTVTEFIVHRWSPIFFKDDGSLTVDVIANGVEIFAGSFPVTIALAPNSQIPPALHLPPTRPS
ncbi:MAG: hypothetical protein ACT6Q8_18690 [Niveispirillum sp.]|uniref:hypothetical protein n=1 Tax=Niveispirillum sp. TaxID=1917217 RepID=UPI0040365813